MSMRDRGRGRGGHPYGNRLPRNRPRTTDDPATKLYVGNLDHRINEGQLFKIFGKFGDLNRVDFVWRPDGKPAGFCFVIFQTASDAVKAQFNVNGRLAMGRRLVVSFAEEKPTTKKDKDQFGKRKFNEAGSSSTIRLLAKNVPQDASKDEKINALQTALNKMKQTGTLAPEFSSNEVVDMAKQKAAAEEAKRKTAIIVHTAAEHVQYLATIEAEMEKEAAEEKQALTKQSKAVAQEVIRKLQREYDDMKAKAALAEERERRAREVAEENRVSQDAQKVYGPPVPPSIAEERPEDVT
ncbi:hypothetical protein SARC_04575 [Sphaeroforma arctica JP610]|uniref:RRM domain-containing protein n=1 Tax=Sphaeroforma arctica JP610 TaxID=667725 RepID=A0A0L0G2U5_9EUKA|nr:hypothetical protein SARC_04575 [Sphaeroforma arctica JP610]KNC83169.1 hypothetical protein SARC_04575 [Sphaeroforma arctica JP610]|eukprot:XP_014157071.1 hypothetical protein SARC_04575 [Sphaeroforma arctica JP610]